jgi:RNA polymerase primary sigma factor
MRGDAERPTLYLHEIGRFPLLTRQEEGALATRVERGCKKARETMITANLRLVIKIAMGFAGRGLSLQDLIAEGNIGLIKAVDRFDPARGTKLSTYASFWIRQCIQRALANHSSSVRLPVHLAEKAVQLTKVARCLAEALGREPTEDELAAETGIPVAKVGILRRREARMVSLDGPCHSDTGAEFSSFGEILRDERAVDPCEQASRRDLEGCLVQVAAVLNERERRVIKLRFGMGGDPEWTLEELAREFGCSRENIRLIQVSVLRKMRLALQELEEGSVRDLGEKM